MRSRAKVRAFVWCHPWTAWPTPLKHRRCLARSRLIYLAAVAVWVGCGLLYVTLPPSPDQFQHAYLGWRLLAGELPYRDFIDVNWPGVMTWHAVAIWLFGINLWSWRV